MTKNDLLKKMGIVVTALVALVAFSFVSPRIAGAVNSQDAVSAEADSRANSAYVQGGSAALNTTNATPGSGLSAVMNLLYTGTAADAEVTISTTNKNIAFYAPGGTLATDIGGATGGFASGAFDLSTSTGGNTLGTLCDNINNATSGLWHCKLIGGTRVDLSTMTLPTVVQSAGVNSMLAPGGYYVAFGSNTVLSLGITPAPGRRVILKQCSVNQQGTSFVISGRLSKYAGGTDEFGTAVNDGTTVWSSQVTAATLAYWPQQYSTAPWIEFASNPGYPRTAQPTGTAYDGHVVVRASNYIPGGGGLGQTTSQNIQCSWLER